jgi:hypothetical protein
VKYELTTQRLRAVRPGEESAMGDALRLERPWGYELVWRVPPDFVGRIVHVRRGHRLWLESNGEPWRSVVLCSGALMLAFEDERGQLREIMLEPGHLHEIPAQHRHRLIVLQDADLLAIAPAGNDDFVRLEDA